MSDLALKRFNILFSGDATTDVANLCRYIDAFGEDIGLKSVEIDLPAARGALGVMVQDFPWELGADKASPFKKVASFTTNFIAKKPILTSFPDELFGPLAHHQNAILAFSLSVDSLLGATIECPKRKKQIVLKNRISISKHYWQELIVALSAAIPYQHFRCVALLYEALAYQANPEAAYTRVI